MSPQPHHTRVSGGNQTLQDFLCAWLALSRNRAKALLDSRVVFVNGTRIWMARHALRNGDLVEVMATPPARGPGETVGVLFENENFLVVNKPAGCLSNGPGSIEETLRRLRRDPGLQAAHRLDRDTTGCLLVARTTTAFEAVISCFREHRVSKTYHALVAGRVREDERRIETPLEGTPACTLLRVLDRSDSASHVAARIETGRTHQIRKHLAGIGHAVLGDKQYGTVALLAPELRQVERQMLHASRLGFVSPMDGSRVSAEAPLPADFRRWMKRLRLE